MKTVLHPTDFSDCAARAGDRAAELAAGLGAELVLLHVYTYNPTAYEGLKGEAAVERLEQEHVAAARAALEREARRLARAGLEVRTELAGGVPVDEIVAAAEREGADLVVLGTHGRGGWSRLLLGSVADRVIRLADAPVMTVKEPAAAE